MLAHMHQMLSIEGTAPNRAATATFCISVFALAVRYIVNAVSNYAFHCFKISQAHMGVSIGSGLERSLRSSDRTAEVAFLGEIFILFLVSDDAHAFL